MKSRFIHIILIVAALLCGPVASSAAVRDGAEEVAEAVAQSQTVTAVDGGVEIENLSDDAREAYVVAITGRVVRQLSIASGDKVRIELPSGIYVVKVGDTARRIAIR